MVQKRDADSSANWRSRLFDSPQPERGVSGDTAEKPSQTRPGSPTVLKQRSQGDTRPTIGATMTIKGDLIGNEDVVLKGKVEGNIMLSDNDIVIDRSGRLDGSVVAKHVIIHGETKGEIHGVEKVSIFATGRVQGTITAPRMVLEDGGRFKGLIDMQFDDSADEENADQSEKPGQQAPKRPASAGPAGDKEATANESSKP